jgi:hypothetical protein
VGIVLVEVVVLVYSVVVVVRTEVRNWVLCSVEVIVNGTNTIVVTVGIVLVVVVVLV